MLLPRTRWSCIVLVGVALCPPVLAQKTREYGPAPITSGDTGRISCIAASSTDPDLVFVGGADGGVWRTRDGGVSWKPLTDDMPTTAIGALALAPSDESIVFAGTGEPNYANHSRYGLGLFKSTDGGNSWTQKAKHTFGGRCFSRIVVHPTDPQIVYASITRAGGFPELAAAKGHPRAKGPLGVFQSLDGGSSWTRFSGLPDLSASDLVMKPGAPNVLYAAIGRIFGDSRNGIYKTTDGGANWTKLAGGLPTSDVGRISLAVCPSRPSRLYTLVTQASTSTGGSAATRGAYRSDNNGNSWTQLSSLGNIQASYGWYLCVVSVDPTDSDTVFFGGYSLERSTNAGGSFNDRTPPHVDMHALEWDASGRLLAGDDGGFHRTSSLGNSWAALNVGLGTIQFYAGLSTHPGQPRTLFGGTQDNGTNRRNTTTKSWTRVFGGDGGWTLVHPTNPDIVFCEYQGSGNLYRSTNGGGSFNSSSSGISGSDRHCFLPPFAFDPTNPSRMFYATHRLYRSTNTGSNWSSISGDLTNGSGAIRALAIAPSDPDVLYVASNDGRVSVSSSGGSSFSTIRSNHPGWPRTTRELLVHPRDEDTVYLAVAAFRTHQIVVSHDRGQSWRNLDQNLPDLPVNVLALDERSTGPILYAGTDAGLYWSPNGGGSWRYVEGLPRACVIDLRLELNRSRLIVGTQGRGAWKVKVIAGRGPQEGGVK